MSIITNLKNTHKLLITTSLIALSLLAMTVSTDKAIASDHVLSSQSDAGGIAILKVDRNNDLYVRFEYMSPDCQESGGDPIEALPLIVNGKVFETLSVCSSKGVNSFFPKYKEDNELIIATFFQEDFVTLTQDGFTEEFPSGQDVAKLYAYQDLQQGG